MTNEINPLYIWMQTIRVALTAVYLHVHNRPVTVRVAISYCILEVRMFSQGAFYDHLVYLSLLINDVSDDQSTRYSMS